MVKLIKCFLAQIITYVFACDLVGIFNIHCMYPLKKSTV